MSVESKQSVDDFLVEKICVDLGNIRVTLLQLRDHVVLNGDLRTRITIDLVVKRLEGIENDAREATEYLARNHDGSSEIDKEAMGP